MDESINTKVSMVDTLAASPEESAGINADEMIESEKQSDSDAALGAIKELTTQIASMTKVINTMKQTHDKWVRAGKF